MDYDTALRAYSARRIEEIQSADILVGIPCFNNETTIQHVIRVVSHGLAKHYQDKRSVILVADGGSTDDTREAAKECQIKPWQEKLVSIYRGPGGKGTALRSVFEAGSRGIVRILLLDVIFLKSVILIAYRSYRKCEESLKFTCPVGAVSSVIHGKGAVFRCRFGRKVCLARSRSLLNRLCHGRRDLQCVVGLIISGISFPLAFRAPAH